MCGHGSIGTVKKVAMEDGLVTPREAGKNWPGSGRGTDRVEYVQGGPLRRAATAFSKSRLSHAAEHDRGCQTLGEITHRPVLGGTTSDHRDSQRNWIGADADERRRRCSGMSPLVRQSGQAVL